MEVILFLVKAVCGHKERRAYSCESWRASEAQLTNTTDTLADLNLQHRTEPQRNLQQSQPLTLFPFPKPHTSAEGPKCLCWTQSYLEDCYSPSCTSAGFPAALYPFRSTGLAGASLSWFCPQLFLRCLLPSPRSKPVPGDLPADASTTPALLLPDASS